MDAAGEDGIDPQIVSALWQVSDEYKQARKDLKNKEEELVYLLSKLEKLNMSIVSMLKICNEPLLVAQVLHKGRFSLENTPEPRSLTEIYARVSIVSKKIKEDTGDRGSQA